MKYLEKIEANSDALPALMRALRQTIGNKVYMNDLEPLFEKLEPLSAEDNDTLWYLIRDLKHLRG